MQGTPAEPTPEALEAEVLGNVKHQALGPGTVEDLAMPEAFLQRVADRVIRSSYEERYRVVVPEVGIRAGPSAAVYFGAGAVLVAAAVWIWLARRRG